MKAIWNEMDCALQIVDQDQFSSSVTEPLYLGKEIILSNIRAYQVLEEKFGLNMNMIDNNVYELYRIMKKIISGEDIASEKEKKNRIEFVKEHLNFSKNLKKMEDFYFKSILPSL
jgi:hypothetical protein